MAKRKRPAKKGNAVRKLGPIRLPNNQLEAAAPAQPTHPTKPAPQDDHTKRVGNHNELPRRDPSGARGNRDERRGHQTRADKTRR